MIIVRIRSAGLGNILFQYFSAKAIAKKNNCELKFDISSIEKNQMPFYSLTKEEKIEYLNESILAFDIDFQIASIEDIKKVRGFLYQPKIKNTFVKNFFHKIEKKIAFNNYFYEKDPFKYYKKLNNYNNLYLNGLLINPVYFSNEVNFSFKLSRKLSKSSFNELKEIKKNNSVAIHIRRGDYLGLKLYPSLSKTYYLKAISEIEKTQENVKYFFFSDDIEWCKEKFKNINNSIFISGNKPYEDFWLMMNCKHNIISNSTYAWWASRLNQNPNKKIFGPSKWINKYKIDDTFFFYQKLPHN